MCASDYPRAHFIPVIDQTSTDFCSSYDRVLGVSYDIISGKFCGVCYNYTDSYPFDDKLDLLGLHPDDIPSGVKVGVPILSEIIPSFDTVQEAAECVNKKYPDAKQIEFNDILEARAKKTVTLEIDLSDMFLKGEYDRYENGGK